jgi:hypothetical protein
LAALGWSVLRLWDFEVRRDLLGCVERVIAVLNGEDDAVHRLASREEGAGDAGRLRRA